MTLKDYLDKYELTAGYMAKRMNASVSAVRKWVQGTRIPRLPNIKKLKKITNGEVSYDDWR